MPFAHKHIAPEHATDTIQQRAIAFTSHEPHQEHPPTLAPGCPLV